MPPERRRSKLASLSDRLLGSLAIIRGLERQKREEPISSPEFHRLAREIEDEGRRVFRIAAEEAAQGEDLEPNGDAIDDIAKQREA